MISNELFAIWLCGLISPSSKFLVFSVISFILPVDENQVKQWSSQENCNYRIEFWKKFKLLEDWNPGLPDTNWVILPTKPRSHMPGAWVAFRGFLFPVANFILIFFLRQINSEFVISN